MQSAGCKISNRKVVVVNYRAATPLPKEQTLPRRHLQTENISDSKPFWNSKDAGDDRTERTNGGLKC